MPELPECRKCAACCGECIFLSYAPATELFSCLIYKNKHRTKVNLEDEDWFVKTPEEHLFDQLEEIVSGSYCKVCHNFYCHNDFERNYYHQFIEDQKEKALRTQAKVRERIPDFDTLIEILNAEVTK
jgi:hypothetical protein